MSVKYAPVKWNRNKRVYDSVIAIGVGLYLSVFLSIGFTTTEISAPILLMRAFGTCAFLMLHIALSFGPLARLDPRLLPLVYNRRHLGVATFLVALAHVLVAVGFYHGFGVLNPLRSLLVNGTFELCGLAAFAILLLMAATSHDFWQKMLGPSFWKWLHMLVYPAYALLVIHVLLGAIISEKVTMYAIILVIGFLTITSLHIAVGLKELRNDSGGSPEASWLEIGTVDEIPESRAKVVAIPNRERVAVFKHGDCVSAVTNVCAHQRGPLGEGKIVNGCITCPWHGWDYRPEDGCSPPPFDERIATYRVRVEGRRILLNPEPLPPGTPVEPARIGWPLGE